MKNILLAICLLPCLLSAQKEAVRQEIAAIGQAYSDLSEMRSEIEYIMYAGHRPGAKEIDREKAVMSRSGDAYHFKIGPIETLLTKDYNIAADHEDKTLTIDKIRNPSMRTEQQFGLDMVTALNACDTVWLSEPAAGTKKISLVIALPDLEKAELWFDAKTHLMQKVVLYYREAEIWEENKPAAKARMEILYRRQEKSPTFAKDLFSVTRFVRRNAVTGSFSPAPYFQQYTYTDQTNIQ